VNWREYLFQRLFQQLFLGDPKLRSGLGEVQRFTHSQEISQVPEFHYAGKAWQRKERGIGRLNLA